MSLPTNNWR